MTNPFKMYTDTAQYLKTLPKTMNLGSASLSETSSPNFLNFLEAQKNQIVGALEKAEQEGLNAVSGQGDVNSFVTAMAESNLVIKAMLALRDKLLQVMQEIRNMQV